MVSVEDPAPGAVGKLGRRRAADPPPVDPFRASWTVATAALAAATGVAQLLVNGTGRILLILVALAALAVLGARLGTGRYGRIARLETELAAASLAIHRYRSAVERIVDRQYPLFEEEVELTIVVGDRSGEDTIVERHRTTPKPYLVYRTLRPITAANGRVRPCFEDLELTCEVDGDDTTVTVLPVSETADGVLVLILFQPGLKRTTEWSIRYKAPRLWDPLREDGSDRLAWSPSNRDGRERTIAVTDLTVHFVFPSGARTVQVRECEELGTGPVRGSATGDRRITWRDPAPAAQRYEWELWCSG
jgi:hypothetical protein